MYNNADLLQWTKRKRKDFSKIGNKRELTEKHRNTLYKIICFAYPLMFWGTFCYSFEP